MAGRSLHIAWLGPKPGEDGGAQGVATDLLAGLTALGYRIDCFFPSSGSTLPERLAGIENLTFNWGTSDWKWGRWYSRTRLTAFMSGMVARSISLVRLRREIAARHERDPYDIIYQFSTIESLGVPGRLTRTVPLVIHPEAHSAGELRELIAERRLGLRCQTRLRFATIAAIMLLRALVQRVRIRRARLLICISSVFRDRLIRDYGFPAGDTTIVQNSVRLDRFTPLEHPQGEPPTVLVLGRIAVRKGIEDVVAVARASLERGSDVRFRVVGAPSLFSDYTPLLEDLPAENSEYVGAVAASDIPGQLAETDLLLAPSRYEPFGLTVGEALAAGVPVVGTSEVGAIEYVDRSVAAEVAPGDVPALVDAIAEMLERFRAAPAEMRAKARAEAERLFAPEVICGQLASALEQLVAAAEAERAQRAQRAPRRAPAVADPPRSRGT
jgi:glycosyltransferase involved in cell wall biosynthesis